MNIIKNLCGHLMSKCKTIQSTLLKLKYLIFLKRTYININIVNISCNKHVNKGGVPVSIRAQNSFIIIIFIENLVL